MRRLVLIRHAKSSWDDPLLDDHDRPLNDRGRRSATLIGGWLKAEDAVPGEAFVSTAKRAAETWLGVQASLGTPAHIHWRSDLYHAAPQDMLEAIRGATEPCVSLVSHNPGSAVFARMIAAQPFPHPRFLDYPTAATAVIDFDIDAWHAIDWGLGTVAQFTVPRDLDEA